MSGNWIEPRKNEQFLCDDGVVRTWSELVSNIKDDVYPATSAECAMLLLCFGAVPLAQTLNLRN